MSSAARRCFGTWRCGLSANKRGKGILAWTFLAALIFSASLEAKSYKSVLKENTKRKTVYVWDNMEVRLIWNATYLSPEFQGKLEEKLAEMGMEKTASATRWWLQHELDKSDVFFVGLYEGSAKWPEIGKDDASLRFQLVDDTGKVTEARRIEAVPVTQAERVLFPYLDKWSKAYLVKFPKAVAGPRMKLKLLSPAATSEVKWK